MSVSIGNGPNAVALPTVEVCLSTEGIPIYTREDKEGIANRTIDLLCPAALSGDLNQKLRQLVLQAFEVLQCRDWARVKFRMDESGNLYIMKVNTLPGLGSISSLPAAAA